MVFSLCVKVLSVFLCVWISSSWKYTSWIRSGAPQQPHFGLISSNEAVLLDTDTFCVWVSWRQRRYGETQTLGKQWPGGYCIQGLERSSLIWWLAWETDAPKKAASPSLSIPSTSEVTTGLGAAHGIPCHLASAPPGQPAALQCFPHVLSHRINFTQKFARF